MHTQSAPIRQPGEEGRGASAAWMLAEAMPFAAEGSRPLHIFRLGPIYDRTSGALIADITDAMLAELVRVFPLQRADGQTVPLDWAHGSEMASTPEEAGPLGEVVGLRHIPGQGMWAEVAWTARGVRVVSDGAPALYTSPAFDLAPVFSKATGLKLGDAYLRSVALTDRPRQDRLDPVCLSETTPATSRKGATAMADTATAAPAVAAGTLAPMPGAPAPAPAPAPVPAIDINAEPADLPSALAIIAALREQMAKVQGEAAEWKAKCEEMGAPAEEAPSAEMSQPSAAQLAELNAVTQRLALAERTLAKVQAERAAEARKARLDLCESKGYYAPARRPYFAALAERAPDLFEAEMARLAKNPEVQLGEVGHGQPVAPAPVVDPQDALHAEVVKLCEAKGWDAKRHYGAALAEVRRVNPAVFNAANQKGA